MTTTYHLRTNELNVDFLKSIKAAYKDKSIEITVTEVIDETEYLLASDANREHLYSSIKELEDGKGISFSVAELQEKYGK